MPKDISSGGFVDFIKQILASTQFCNMSIQSQPKANNQEKLPEKEFALIMKYFDYDLNELIYFFMDTPENSNIEEIFGKNRLIKLKSAFYDKFYSRRKPNNYIHESIIELTILNIMKTLYALVDTCTENGNSKSTYQLKFKSMAHGDIKPLNVLIRSSKNQRPEIVLTDYGTCGANESANVKGSKYAGTPSHLPPNRLTDEDIVSITNTYVSMHTYTNTTNATASSKRPPRVSGNADHG